MKRTVDLSNLVKVNQKNKEVILWSKSVGRIIPFIYDDIIGELEIVDYKSQTLYVRYNERTTPISIEHMRKGNIARCIGLKNTDYIFKKGEIIHCNKGDFEVISMFREKGVRKYECKCLTCKETSTKQEDSLKRGVGCKFCDGKEVAVGLNDMATTAPWMMKYLSNINDAYKYARNSNQYIMFKCPDCDDEKSNKPNNIYNNGFKCVCADVGVYTEKVVLNTLKCLNVSFKHRVTFDWSLSREYDFYIEDLNMIIECHGEQHYRQTNIGEKTYEEIHENDLLKFDLSVINGIEYFVIIDCQQSKFEYIKENLVKSMLSEIYDFSKIDWTEVERLAERNIVKEACDMYMQGVSLDKIADSLTISRSTLKCYLNRGVKHNWCDYDGLTAHYNRVKSVSKSIICVNNGMFFNSLRDLERKGRETFGSFMSRKKVAQVCDGELESYKGLSFRYATEKEVEENYKQNANYKLNQWK